MAQIPSQVVATELEKVTSKVPTLFDREATFYSAIEKRPVEVISTRDMRVPMELRPGGRFGHWDPAGGDLGRGDGATYDKATVNTVHLRHAVEYQTKAAWATDDNRKSVINTFRSLMANAMKDFRRQVDSLCMTDGTGVLGVVTSVSTPSGDTVVLTTDGFGARLLRFGQFYSIYDTTLGTRRTFTGGSSAAGEADINSYDGPNKTVGFSGTTGATIAGDKIVVSGLTATPPVSLNGIPYHHTNAATGTWQGYTRSATPEIRANRINAGGSALALSFARLAMNQVGDRLGDDAVRKTEAWMHPCQVQAYEELGQLVSVINKEKQQQSFDLYFNDNMQIAGAPIRKSWSWDKKRIDFVAKDVWGRAEFHPPGFYDVEGRKLFEIRGSSGGVAASQVFYIVASFNLFVNNPAACVYIDNLAVPSGY